MVEIYRNGSVIIDVHPADGDKVVKKVMGENTLSLTANLANAFNFSVGDYLFFDGERYTLNVIPKLKKSASNLFSYDLIFEGIEYELRKARFLFYTQNLDYVGGADFSLMGDAALFARIIVENLNRVQTGWSVGETITSEAKNLTFSNNSCLEAITSVVNAFETEYWVGQDQTINIGIRGDILPVTFEYGKGKGLYSIERENVSSSDIVTRLYPFGSDANLPKGYRENAKRLQIPTSYVEKNVDKFGVIEGSETFDDIKPERTGTVTSVGDIFTFADSSMDFDLNAKDENQNTLYLIPDTKAKIHFQTGDLAGYEFDITSYDHATKTFIVAKFTNEVAYDLPNNTLKPKVGDFYILLDIYMPQSYVDAAEAKLLAKAQELLDQKSEPNVAYKVAVDPLFVGRGGFTYKAGDYVGIKDIPLTIDRNIRLVSVTRSVPRPNEYDFDLADTVEPSLTSLVIAALDRADQVLQMNKLLDPARARRSWRTTEELRGAIYDVDGYFDPENIKPFSIETSMLTVGSKGTQFYTDCYFQANYQSNKNSINVGNGSLAHFTIAETIKTWVITGISETLPDDNLRYIYITCQKDANVGQVTLSASTKGIEEGNYYNFFAGVLSSVIDNARQISLLFGFTSVNGRFIKTGRVQSADGQTYFDLDSGEIGGNIKFKNTSGSYESIASTVSSMQSQIDGTISSWFFDYEPTLDNVPAVNWGDAQVMEIHLGDLFYWTSKGYAYRFQKIGSDFSWARIADTDITLALANAAAAQAAANTANALLSDIASDSKLTPNEKQAIKKEWDIIQAEFAGVEAAADNLSLGYDDYDDAYYALSAYITPLLANMTTTSTIDSATFNGIFSTYYMQKLNLLNTISATINLTARAALNQANAVFPKDDGLMAHWSFDNDPIIPDGSTPTYQSVKDWVNGVDGWNGSSSMISVENNALKSSNSINANGAVIIRDWSEIFRGKSLIIKVRSKNPIFNSCYYTGTSIVIADNPVVIDQYNWLVRFDNIQVDGFPYLYIYLNNGAVGQTAWFDLIWIGNISFASEVRDNSGNGNTLSTANGSIAVPTGVSGNSRRFNGTEYLSTDSTKFRLPAFSFSVWFNSPGMAAGQTEGGMFTLTSYCRLVINSIGKVVFYLWSGSSWKSITTTITLFNGWHHAVGVFDGSTMYLYVDGVIIGSLATTIVYSNSLLYIGWDANNVAYHFNGMLDEIRFYSRALNSNEILGLYKYITKGKATAIDLEASYLKKAFSEDTSITGGLVATTLLKVGATNSNGDWTEQAGINGAGTGADTPRVYAGGTLQDAIDLVAGDEKQMAVITDDGRLFATAGMIGGFNIAQSGIDKEQTITDDGDAYTGAFELDWVQQVLRFLRDGANKVKISAKKLLTGIPSPFNQSVSSGLWKNQITTSATTTLSTVYTLAPANYSLNLNYSYSINHNNYLVGQYAGGGIIESVNLIANFSITIKVWKVDSSGNKLSVIASQTHYRYINALGNTFERIITQTGSKSIDFNLQNSTNIAFEVIVVGVDNSSYSWSSDTKFGTVLVTFDKYYLNTSATYVGNSEFLEIGYSGIKINTIGQYFIYNFIEAAWQWMVRANAYFLSKGGNTSVYLDDASFRASRTTLQGIVLNIVNKTSNYAISTSAADKALAGIKVVNPGADITITLPDLNAYETVNGVTTYYNDNRAIWVLATTRNVVVYPSGSQKIRNTTGVTISQNTGFLFIGDRASLNWMIVGVG